MTENSRMMCRFCLHEEELDDGNRVANVFDCGIDQFPIKIMNCVQIEVSPDDKIPPNICRKCFEYIEEFSNYLDNCWKSTKVLEGIYGISSSSSWVAKPVKSELNANHLSNKDVITPDKLADCDTNSKSEDHVLDDCDSDFSTIEETEVIKEKKITQKRGGKCLPPNKDITSSREGESTMDQSALKQGKFMVHDARIKVTCDICNMKVLQRSLMAHLSKHTDKYKCQDCGLKHTSKTAMEKHYQARHVGIKGLICYICGKQNSCQSSLKRHLACHSTARPHQCKYCRFSAKSISILNVHTSRKHLAEQCVCKVCAKAFKSQVSLQQHLKRMHNPRKHICNVCGKGFTENYNLKKHVLNKHSMQRLHECKLCSEEFLTVKALKEHMHTHRSGCVSCPNCNKQFFYKKYLEQHMVKCSLDLREKSDTDRNCLKNTVSSPNSPMLSEK